ncbi:MAG TPA: alpha-ribazole phosphatase, partial [Firmicutes bacterium]|nr:alpha-ribazole phosphatase [Bacillota bacterium]
MTTIIFVRHGETLWNRQLRYQGQKDSPLSPVGMDQATKVGEFLRTRAIDAVYSSDLRRALFTAERIGKYHNLIPAADPRLREMSFGVWEGKTRGEVAKEYPELWEARLQDVLATRIPQGELPSEVVERFLSFLNEQTQTGQPKDRVIVVVSHGGALRLVISSLIHVPL